MLDLLTRVDKRLSRLEKWLPPTQTSERLSFERWLPRVSPTWRWDWPYQRYIIEHLARMTRSELDRLMIFMPPRHGKSEMVTVRYVAWRLEQDPTMRTIIAAYNQTLANRFSRKARNIARTRVLLSDDRTAVDDWETTLGGGVRAVGVGAGVTGHGGHLVVIDDPLKSREEANSATYRQRVWDWYTDDLYTRLEPDGQIILIMTRWHEDDLAARILAQDGDRWTVVRLPAEAEEDDPLGRRPGEPLNPDRFDRTALEQIRTVLGNSYYALYQQRPQPQEGGLFQRQWFELVEAAPAQASRVRYWDRAATASGGDYTVGVRMARVQDGIFYIEDVVRGQWSPAERDRVMHQVALLDGPEVAIWVEQEPGSSGVDAIAHTVRMLVGFAVRGDRVTGDKVVRAEPLAAQVQAGNVKLVRGRWNAVFLDELAAFPFGTHDDQVDAASGAFSKLGRDRLARRGKVTRKRPGT